jgi:AAA domain
MNDLLTGAQPKADKGYKIVSLIAENVKRLQAVEIKPDGNLVEITGKNGHGKTSILDAIWWAMKGRGVVQSTPIRKGCEEANIELDLGPIVVRRRFKAAKEGAGFTTTITVEAADGARYPQPQTLLDNLMGELSIDPLAFMRMDAKAQSNMLREFVADFDFDAHERAQKADFEARTTENRRAKELRAQAAGIAIAADLPDEPIDDGALTDELAQAGQHNADIEMRRANCDAARDRIDELRGEAARLETEKPAKVAEISRRAGQQVTDLEAQIEALQKRIEAVNADRDAAVTELNRTTIADRDAALNKANELEAKLNEAGPLPDPIDIGALRQRIATAQQTNAGIAARDRRRELESAASTAEARSAELTKAMTERDAAKAKAIAAAPIPVPGIEFGDGMLMLNGVPLDQASDAEQLRTSVAIAMAIHPKLRVIRVRDGNVLDPDGMKLLAELAAQNDCQVWVETVRQDDRVAFVIEDGRVRQHEEAGEAA